MNEEIINENNEPEVPEFAEVIGVKFKSSGKIYYFDPDGAQYTADTGVIVETARGVEYGYVACENKTVPGTELVLPLRKALRAATQEDDEHLKENARKNGEAFSMCTETIERHGLPMKLVDAEYTFDNSKLLFYFSADGRIDFRDLVKDLAAIFHTRIELRQIGIRDEARMMGGFGVCGRVFCCKSFLNDFTQVTIKMAKDQNLSLNSAKISGACGRLMCCLKYEHEAYEEEISRTPRVDSIVSTPDGDGVVIESHPLTGIVKVRSLKDQNQAPRGYHRDKVKVKGRLNNRREVKVEEDLSKLED